MERWSGWAAVEVFACVRRTIVAACALLIAVQVFSYLRRPRGAAKKPAVEELLVE